MLQKQQNTHPEEGLEAITHAALCLGRCSRPLQFLLHGWPRVAPPGRLRPSGTAGTSAARSSTADTAVGRWAGCSNCTLGSVSKQGGCRGRAGRWCGGAGSAGHWWEAWGVFHLLFQAPPNFIRGRVLWVLAVNKNRRSNQKSAFECSTWSV